MNIIRQYERFADSTKYLIVEENLYDKILDNFIGFIGESSITIICDENTKRATGNDFRIFCKKNSIKIEYELVFPSIPELDSSYSNVEQIISILKSNDSIPVSIGSGTINDLVKRASFEVSREYAVIATAASVDGYASDGAALLYKGLKQTLPCPAPVFIAADLNVLTNAPIESASSGYADLIAKNPAGADWIIADLVKEDPINPKIWSLIQDNLLDLTAEPDQLLLKDSGVFKNVFKGLTIAGFAMQSMKRSRPVSGAEHLMSHVWEMENLIYNGKHVSHGFKVGIGSLATIALMETIMTNELTPGHIVTTVENWPTWDEREKDIRNQFKDMSDINSLIKINREKYITGDKLNIRLNLLLTNWDKLRIALRTHLLTYNDLKSRLFRAGCPVTPGDIGLTGEYIVKTYKKAQMLRNRYTILDLAFETGLLDICSESILNSEFYL